MCYDIAFKSIHETRRETSMETRHFTLSLIRALEQQDQSLINRLIENAHFIDFNEKDLDNNNLLRIALEMNRFDVVKFLLNNDTICREINAKNNSGETALDIAARNDKSGESIELLLRRGAKIEEKTLCNAIQNGNIEGLKKLLHAVKNIPVTLFKSAVLSGKTEIMELLLAKEKEIASNTNQPTPDHSGNLFDATDRQQTGMVRLLLENKANPNYQNNSRTPLSLAAEHKNEEITYLLLNYQALNGIYPALMIATQNNDRNLVTLLLVYGAIPFDALEVSRNLNNGLQHVISEHISERELYKREGAQITHELLTLNNNHTLFFSRPVAEIIHSYMKPTINHAQTFIA